jgi:hypothetical protein
MPSSSDYLHILGLAPGATWKQINEAYRDLINVWHPDRFQNNERLRKKAEEQTRSINAAMDALRKSYKETPAEPQQQNPPPSSPSPFRSSTHRAGFSAQNAQYRQQHQRDVRNAAYQFELAPLLVYQRARASLTKLLFATLVMLVTYLISQQPEAPAERVTGASMLLLSALHIATLHAALLVARRPVVIVSSYGLTSIKTGPIKMRDISRMWSCIEAGTPALAIEYSKNYLNQQNIFARSIFSLRGYIGRAHSVIGCGGFDTHPTVIINRLTMQQLESPSGEANAPSVRSRRIIWWGSTLALCSAVALSARPLIGLSVTSYDMAIYCGFFLLADIAVISQRLMMVKR